MATGPLGNQAGGVERHKPDFFDDRRTKVESAGKGENNRAKEFGTPHRAFPVRAKNRYDPPRPKRRNGGTKHSPKGFSRSCRTQERAMHLRRSQGTAPGHPFSPPNVAPPPSLHTFRPPWEAENHPNAKGHPCTPAPEYAGHTEEPTEGKTPRSPKELRDTDFGRRTPPTLPVFRGFGSVCFATTRGTGKLLTQRAKANDAPPVTGALGTSPFQKHCKQPKLTFHSVTISHPPL